MAIKTHNRPPGEPASNEASGSSEAFSGGAESAPPHRSRPVPKISHPRALPGMASEGYRISCWRGTAGEALPRYPIQTRSGSYSGVTVKVTVLVLTFPTLSTEVTVMVRSPVLRRRNGAL